MATITKKITGLKPGQNYLVVLKAKNTELSAIDESYESVRFLTPTDSTIPGEIDSNTFFIYGNYKSVMFSFEPTVDIDVSKYKYELYSDPQGATLISSGFATATVFTIDVPDNSGSQTDESTQSSVKYYGRIKAVDTSGNEGNFTPATGLKESSATALIESIHVRNLTASKITAGTINAHEIILKQQGAQTSIVAPANMAIIRSSDYNGSYTSNNWNLGTSGWVIAGDGHAEFASASIRGGLRASSVFIDSNNRWQRNAQNTAAANEFKVGSASKYLYYDGTTLAFTGDLSAAGGTFSGNLSAAGGTFLGNLSAAGGTFSGNLSAAGGTFSGDISAASGTFEGDLSGSTITGGSINIGNGTFMVDTSGNLTATSGTFEGDISGATGTFTGNLSGSSITSGSITGSEITGTSLTVGNRIVLPSDGSMITLGAQDGSDATQCYIFAGSSQGFRVETSSRGEIWLAGASIYVNLTQWTSGRQLIGLHAPVGTGQSLVFQDGYVYRVGSRRELKENIEDFNNISMIDLLRPVTFTWKAPTNRIKEETEEQIARRISSTNIGFIAEEVEEVANGLLSIYNHGEDGDGKVEMYKHLDILALAVANIQDLRKRVAELEK